MDVTAFKESLLQFYNVKDLENLQTNDSLKDVNGNFKLFFRLDGSNQIKVTRSNDIANIDFIFEVFGTSVKKVFSMKYDDFVSVIKDSLSIWLLEEC
mgnify:CR=1 FL=1